MSGIESIDFSLENIFLSWHNFKAGKTKTKELYSFQYNLEVNLFQIHQELKHGTYKHGKYQSFEVKDNKKRLITVASIKDRVVHRLLYDYLVVIFDKTFVYDVWSCRKGKGLQSAILRTQKFVHKNKSGYFLRADIKKFFNNVDIQVLYKLVALKVKCKKCLWLLQELLMNFNQPGIPIGNLSSQILANIYLNELDRFIKITLKQKYYLRYGDDFLVFSNSKSELEKLQLQVVKFLNSKLKLQLSSVGGIYKVKQGIQFIGTNIYPFNLLINKRVIQRAFNRLNFQNLSSYCGVIKTVKRNGLNLKLVSTLVPPI
jgi:retron-type reverse transcriptase